MEKPVEKPVEKIVSAAFFAEKSPRSLEGLALVPAAGGRVVLPSLLDYHRDARGRASLSPGRVPGRYLKSRLLHIRNGAVRAFGNIPRGMIFVATEIRNSG